MLTILLLAAATQATAAPTPPKPEKKVCRREMTTGSIMARPVCHTRTEWTQIDAQNAANAAQALDQRSYRMPSQRD
ncbi:hypothetical protein ASE70_17220 [Sphingomonas sp. Leaf22]|uniref:hypothetical protein n=1 Tax=unclassified Sphingomonas TaxID=196159 RepID=UPI0006FA43C7|nr:MULTISPECIES: hypothetical protein [unclassified Sphingomonas]KQM86854.1 hypothetical protein ASE70_17220 [Sphingomonas sp. Leaf22]